ncbi:MAG: ABC transporter ATP-binding protein, partial [Armatimonadetes bacterium]|nr:ABC transporter ATP-binding protein [Armatimonadota bacterium]
MAGRNSPGAEERARGASVALEVLSVEYRGRREPVLALSPLTLRVECGEFVSIIGPSGCGKSTLLKVVAGLLPPTRGAAAINGASVDRPFPGAGVVFQEPVLLDWRTVLGNVMLQADVRRLDRGVYEPRARDLLRRVGLEDFADRRPYELSGGMRQRVSICRALLHDPSLLLMDEPFGALDALTREQMAEDLQRLWMDLGMTVLFVTHIISEAVLLSDRVLVLSARPGRLLADVRVELPRPRAFRGIQ